MSTAPYRFDAVICGERVTGKAELPESPFAFQFGIRSVFKELNRLTGIPFERMEDQNLVVWRQLK
jgi:hypothetical protein